MGFREELEPRMNSQQLLRLCQDLDLVQGGMQGGTNLPLAGMADAKVAVGSHPLTFASVDVAFAKSKTPGGPRRLSYTQWLKAVTYLGEECGRDLFTLILTHVARIQQYAPPQAMEAVMRAAGVPIRGALASSGAGGAGGVHQGLPKLAGSGQQGVAQAEDGAQGLPASYSSDDGDLLPGRLTLLERAVEEEALRLAAAEEEAMAAANAAALGRTPMAARKSAGAMRGLPPAPGPILRTSSASRPMSIAAAALARPSGGVLSTSVDAGAPVAVASPKQAWPDHNRATSPQTNTVLGPPSEFWVTGPPPQSAGAPKGKSTTSAPGSPVSARRDAAVRASLRSPTRSDRSGSPPRASPFTPGYTEPQQYSVQPAMVVKEVWRLPFSLGGSHEGMEMPAWLSEVLARLQAVEAAESERGVQAEQVAARMAALEVEAAAAKAAAAEARARAVEAEQAVSEMKHADELGPHLDDRVSALERHAARAEHAINELCLKAGGAGDGAEVAKVEALESQVRDMQTSLEALQQSGAMKGDVEDLHQQLEELATQAASAEGFQELSNRLEELEKEAVEARKSKEVDAGAAGGAPPLPQRVEELEESVGGLASAMQVRGFTLRSWWMACSVVGEGKGNAKGGGCVYARGWGVLSVSACWLSALECIVLMGAGGGGGGGGAGHGAGPPGQAGGCAAAGGGAGCCGGGGPGDGCCSTGCGCRCIGQG